MVHFGALFGADIMRAVEDHRDQLTPYAVKMAEDATAALRKTSFAEGLRIEADFMAALYRRLGVPEDRIALERESRNTRENAVRSAAIVRERGWRTLVLVTSAAHMPRAAATFRRAGLDVDLLPVDHRYGDRRPTFVPRSDALDRSTAAIRELAGRLVYQVAGYAGP
jgi:uncharacterized SAM-binding protein YcdF (DUF218 family)